MENGYSPEKCPYLPLAILQKFKAASTVTNLPGRGPIFILPPRAVIREAKNSPRITVRELRRKVASLGHQPCWST